MTTAEAHKRYETMSDRELIDLVARTLPRMSWWCQRCPRSVILKPKILQELVKMPAMQPETPAPLPDMVSTGSTKQTALF